MARALDSLDAALNSQPPTSAQAPQPAPSAGDAPPQMAQAKESLAAAAKAAAAALRASRSESVAPPTAASSVAVSTSDQAKSLEGMKADEQGSEYQSPAGATAPTVKADWGKLPKKVAEELSQGQRETIAGEYRNQVETYYRVIAERSKKP